MKTTDVFEGPTTELRVPTPFDLAPSLESGQAHRWRREQEENNDLAGPWHWTVVEGTLIRIRAGPDQGPTGPYFVEIRSSPGRSPKYLESLLREYFRLEDDIEAVYREVSRDQRVADMVRRHRGLRLLRLEPWECLIAFICSANSNIPRIHGNMEAMSEAFGEPLYLDGRVRYTFPTPDRLAQAGEAALRGLGLGFRAPYVAATAVTVARGELDLEELRRMPYPEAQARLMELPGVGPKVSDCVLLHSLDQLEAFPIDVWVRRALAEWYFPGQKAPPDRVMGEWARDHFGRYAGYAELYLFHGRRLGGKQAEDPSLVRALGAE